MIQIYPKFDFHPFPARLETISPLFAHQKINQKAASSHLLPSFNSDRDCIELAGDIASFMSQKMVKGLGLTRTELMLARATAIKYAGKRDKPARLIDTMVRFGVDFLTITPLSQETLMALRASCSAHWNRILAATDSEEDHDQYDDADTSSDESQISVNWDAREENESLPDQGSDEHTQTITRHVENLMRCYVSRQTETTVRSLE